MQNTDITTSSLNTSSLIVKPVKYNDSKLNHNKNKLSIPAIPLLDLKLKFQDRNKQKSGIQNLSLQNQLVSPEDIYMNLSKKVFQHRSTSFPSSIPISSNDPTNLQSVSNISKSKVDIDLTLHSLLKYPLSQYNTQATSNL